MIYYFNYYSIFEICTNAQKLVLTKNVAGRHPTSSQFPSRIDLNPVPDFNNPNLNPKLSLTWPGQFFGHRLGMGQARFLG